VSSVGRTILLLLSLLAVRPAIAQEQAASVPAATSPSATSPAAASSAVAGATDDYVLGVADRVRITVYGEALLSGEYPVNSNGTISLPLVGEVPAKGNTPGQLQTAIQTALADGYLVNPRVAVDVLTFRPFFILGEVNKSGQYPFSTGLTVMNAVATAEGFTYRASQKYVFIKHAGSEREERVRLNNDLMVQPGDTIRVPQRFF
jgi:protein involved in polysaccharide export with SLBB domain